MASEDEVTPGNKLNDNLVGRELHAVMLIIVIWWELRFPSVLKLLDEFEQARKSEIWISKQKRSMNSREIAFTENMSRLTCRLHPFENLYRYILLKMTARMTNGEVTQIPDFQSQLSFHQPTRIPYRNRISKRVQFLQDVVHLHTDQPFLLRFRAL